MGFDFDAVLRMLPCTSDRSPAGPRYMNFTGNYEESA